VSGKTEKEARDKLRQKLRERELGLTGAGDRTTMKAFLEGWINETVRQSDLSPRTIENYERLCGCV
jgi:hypothetical protein